MKRPFYFHVITITIFGLMGAGAVFSFSLKKNSLVFGDSVHLDEIKPETYYHVFNPEDIKNGGAPCAIVHASELIDTGNGLDNYGTCFINDEGDFGILELQEPTSGSYAALKRENSPSDEKIVTMKRKAQVDE